MRRCFILLVSCFTLSYCGSPTNTERDPTNRPDNVPGHASLIDLGFVDMPVNQWVWYNGYMHDDSNMDHILEFVYADKNGKILYTQYYENISLRENQVHIPDDLTEYKIEPFPGDLSIRFSYSDQRLILFNVLQFNKWDRTYNGVEYTRMPSTIIDQGGNQVSGGEVEFSIQKNTEGYYEIDFTEKRVKYQLQEDCELSKISYLDRTTGRVYLINKGCHLELADKSDIDIILNLN